MILDIFLDGLFAAIAAIGFAAINRPPRRAYLYCALVAACAHICRYILMSPELCGAGIIPASFAASLLAGVLAVSLSPIAKMPAETCFFPSLLPMIPGIYAYKTFGGLAMCLVSDTHQAFEHAFYLFAQNGLTCTAVLIVMVIGATLPVFFMKKISFEATRNQDI